MTLAARDACKLNYPSPGAVYNFVSETTVKFTFQSPVTIVVNACPGNPNFTCSDTFVQSGVPYKFSDPFRRGDGSIERPHTITIMISNYNGVSQSTVWTDIS